MNTPPTMSTAPLPMAPVKSNRKQVNKLDVKPKKLMYNDQEFEMLSKEETSVIYSVESLEIQEKIQSPVKYKRKESPDLKSLGKHVEQNELDNESEKVKKEDIKVEHPYNLRRRNKTPIWQLKQMVPRKRIIVKREFEDEKENIQAEIGSTSGISICTNLSQPPDDMDAREKVKWYQARRDVGLWIQCCNKSCQKWRFVESIHDPLNVPEVWFCALNPSEFYSSCEDPIQESFFLYKKDLIHNQYNAGSLVWGRVNGFPWWPGMIDDCPETFSYYQLNGKSQIPIRYHVTFFEEKPLRAWLTPRCIEPLKQDDVIQPGKRKRLVYRGVNYTEEVKKHLEEAKSIIPLTIKERLEKYSFFSRCDGKILEKIVKGKLKKRKPCRIGIMKSMRRRKPNYKKVSQIPALKKEEIPVFPESTLEQNVALNTQTTCISADLFEETCQIEIEISQDSGFSANQNNSQKVGPDKPFDKEAALAMIKHFVNTTLYQEHMNLTGRDLFEDTKRRQERRRRKELQKERLYFDVEYEASSEISSQASSSAYGSPKSEYVYSSQPESSKKISLLRSRPDFSRKISLVPHVVLKRNRQVEDLLQKALAKKAKLN